VAFHQIVQRLLLIGVKLDRPSPLEAAPPPEALLPLIEAVRAEHRKFDQRAIHFGHRYRSGFWAIYLLSALAVLCAVLPLALGWDSASHLLHPYAGVWAVGEVFVIGTVSAIYWLGHRRDWQGEWLRARTTAELTWYLPMLAPLLDFDKPAAPNADPNWYVRKFDPGHHLRTADEVGALCTKLEPVARRALAGAWSDPVFLESYARWTADVLEEQRRYHSGIAAKQHHLLHRTHSLNACLFVLTAVAALMHLLIHTLWLSLVTTFFPALGASLHGALAQSEAYRLGTTSERLAGELRRAADQIRAAVWAPAGGRDSTALSVAVEAALAMILEEHQDWNLLVRPHHLPLA
jgi:hypothetical protein